MQIREIQTQTDGKMHFDDRSEDERRAIDTTIDALSICIMALNPARMTIRDEEHLDRVIKRFTTLWDEGRDTILAIKNLDIFDEYAPQDAS